MIAENKNSFCLTQQEQALFTFYVQRNVLIQAGCQKFKNNLKVTCRFSINNSICNNE